MADGLEPGKRRINYDGTVTDFWNDLKNEHPIATLPAEMVWPVSIAPAAIEAPQSLREGDYLGAGLNALGLFPVAGIVKAGLADMKYGKGLSDLAQQAWGHAVRSPQAMEGAVDLALRGTHARNTGKVLFAGGAGGEVAQAGGSAADRVDLSPLRDSSNPWYKRIYQAITDLF